MASTMVVRATVPPGAAPGSSISLQLPSGQIVSVVVPAGLSAGQQFDATVPMPSKPAPVVQAVAVDMPGAIPGAVAGGGYLQQYAPRAALPHSQQSYTSMGLIAGSLLLGFVSAATAGNLVPSLASGSLATILFIIAVPLMSAAATTYKRLRGDNRPSNLAIVGWVFYALGVLDALALVYMGVADLDVPAGWIVSATLWGGATWLWMFADGENARKANLVAARL